MSETKAVTIRLEKKYLDILVNLSKKTGKTKTDVIKTAINFLDMDSKQDHQQIELLSKQNEQLKMIMSATQAVIDEKEHVIHSKDSLIKAKDDLIAELRYKKKGFFARLFS